jgi:lysophospholipase L1-like esterase
MTIRSFAPRNVIAAIFLCGLAPMALAQAERPEAGGEKKRDPVLQPIEDVSGLPRVLLIGDSISMGYTVAVRERLAGKANVHRIPANGGSTKDGLAKLDQWLQMGGAGKKWDVIHFNWGLHDLKHWKDNKLDLAGPQVVPIEIYEQNLRELSARLKQTGAKLIFATTTPVPEGSAGRVPGSELAYNAAARKIMEEAKVGINDLHAAALPKLPQLQLPKNVHFTPDGSRVLGEQVAEAIANRLKE